MEIPCGIRGCSGRHTGQIASSAGYSILRCSKSSLHKAWAVDGQWKWATKRPTEAAKDAPSVKDPPSPASVPSAAQAVVERQHGEEEEEKDEEEPATPERFIFPSLADSPCRASPTSSSKSDEKPPDGPSGAEQLLATWTDSDRNQHVMRLLREDQPELYHKLLMEAAEHALQKGGAAKHETAPGNVPDRFVPRSRKAASFVWQHCHLLRSEEGRSWHCNHCGFTGKYNAGNTTNMAEHLRTRHAVHKPKASMGAKDGATEDSSARWWTEQELAWGAKALPIQIQICQYVMCLFIFNAQIYL